MAEQQTPPAGRQVLLQKMYVKDASLEVPQAPQIFTRQWQPETDVQVNTQYTNLGDNNHQVMLSVTVTAKAGTDVGFLVEVHQAGIFTITGFDEVELGAVLGGYAPGLLFPFAREAVADLVQRAGFPQLLLQPINFDQLYIDHQQRAKAEQAGQAEGSGIILPPTLN
ncbi:protein-export chaperone SecB [Stenotrophobium rhamnosiphilum]|uniref:Protein-export protein SecB n=1 Tax=Stenotrophobium rhamnosiphilum TaxID=2029166 RepID=A0A2T5MG96_9GAMM|nr:protein-export chaperone SecB [Stenotrophobium rhamnosiphilum]PTU31608.1 protein-export chaperone SecB [Stenotrophobium rhamnosiphilum]